MRVTKRDGSDEDVSFDKVLRRIRLLCTDLKGVDPHSIAQKVCSRIYDGVRTSELDELAAQMCASLVTEHPDYGLLAARIIVSNHHKNTSPSFSETMSMLYHATDVHGKQNALINEELWNMIQMHKEKLNSVIDYERDYAFDYFGFKTLERSYLLKVNGKTIERPQHMWMRVALGIHGTDLKDAIETYDMMSRKKFTHATPTLFNAGTKENANLASCFLMDMRDSIKGIFKTVTDCALISKVGGGIGIHIHDIRARGSHIRGTNGQGSGIIPMLRVLNATACYVNQCQCEGTLVYSTKGAMKVEEVSNDDKLLTKDGTFRDVLGISKNHVNKRILKVRIANSIEPHRLTKEHEVYVIPNQRKTLNYSVIRNRLEKGIVKADYISAENLTENDLLGFPIPTYEKDVDKPEDYFRFYGLMIGDGTIDKRDHRYSIVMNRDTKVRAINFMKYYLDNNNIKYYLYECKDSNAIRIDWKDRSGMIKYEELYDECGEKRIMETYLHIPKPKLYKLILGLLETDGSIGHEVYFYNTSKSVIYALRYMLLRLHILCAGYITPPRDSELINRSGKYVKISGNKNVFCVRIPRHMNLKHVLGDCIDYSTQVKYFEYDNMLWSRIKSIDTEHYEGYVYDFNMEDNHNYLTDMGLVHNSGKRNGSIALYLEPWHADIESFLDIRKNHGNEEERCRDLFTALWIPDLFMRRVQENGEWSLMCPDECPGLSGVYGEEFEKLYEKYEAEGRYRKKVKAQNLWVEVIKSQIESGTPYLCYKDAVNRKTNQKNVGVIRSSNLCSEVMEYSDETEAATCNLASIALPNYIKDGVYDFNELHKAAQILTKNINKVIDRTFYPTPETEKSNRRHRPIGLGVQGLADTYAILRLSFDSSEAAELNKKIFATIYHGAVTASIAIAKKRQELIEEYENANTTSERKTEIDKHLHRTDGEMTMKTYRGAYETFDGSPASQGQLQYDLWNAEPDSMWDWNTLKQDLAKYGMRNSLLLAPMPTASTSQILSSNECFEPFTSNFYQRRTLAGEFTIINKYLVRDLIALGLWSPQIKNQILAHGGSVQNIDTIPQDIKDLYKTAWELKQKVLIDQAADRGIYVCQSQSLNLFVEDAEFSKLTNMHFYAWKKGLKTGIYYLRTRPKAKTMAFTLDPSMTKSPQKTVQRPAAEDEKECLMCSA